MVSNALECMEKAELALSVSSLGAFLWVLLYQVPRARRRDEGFAIACSLLTGLIALLVWLFIGIRTDS